MSNRKLWQYRPDEGDQSISEVDTDTVVMYTDDIKSEVITTIVDMWNANKSLAEILKVMNKDVDNVILDQYDHIEEQLGHFVNLILKEREKDVPETETGAPQSTPVAEPTKDTGALVQDVKTPGEIPTVVTPERKQRGPNKTKTGTGKALSAAEIVAQYQERIELLQYIDGIAIAEVPVGIKISVAGRKILASLQDSVEQAKTQSIL